MEIKQITGVDLPLQPGILMLEETPEDIDTKNLSYLLGVFADRKEDDNSAIMEKCKATNCPTMEGKVSGKLWVIAHWLE